jgi:hypothetical protein
VRFAANDTTPPAQTPATAGRAKQICNQQRSCPHETSISVGDRRARPRDCCSTSGTTRSSSRLLTAQ